MSSLEVVSVRQHVIVAGQVDAMSSLSDRNNSVFVFQDLDIPAGKILEMLSRGNLDQQSPWGQHTNTHEHTKQCLAALLLTPIHNQELVTSRRVQTAEVPCL